MKTLKHFVFVALLMVVAAVLLLVSCVDDEYTISYLTEYLKVEAKIVEDGKKLTEKELPTLQYKDYEFLGWYIGSERISVGYVVTSNLTLTAKWKLPEEEEANTEFIITFTTDYGKTPHSITVDKGQKITSKDLPELTASGYTFVGWFDGDEQIEVGYKVVSDMDLIAKWDEGSLTITYVSEYGKTPNSQKVVNGYKLSIDDLPNLTTDACSFLGWYDGDTKIEIGYEVSGNLNLNAKWCSNNANIMGRHYPDINKYLGKRYRYHCSETFNYNEYILAEGTSGFQNILLKSGNVEYIDIFFCGGGKGIEVTPLDSDFNVITSGLKDIVQENKCVYSFVFDYVYGRHSLHRGEILCIVGIQNELGSNSPGGFYFNKDTILTSIEIAICEYNDNLYIGYSPIYQLPASGDFEIPDPVDFEPNENDDEIPELEEFEPKESYYIRMDQEYVIDGDVIDYNSCINDNGIILDRMGNIRYVQAENFVYPVYVLEEVK